MRRHMLAVLVLAAAAPAARPQGLDYVKSHYTKFEYRVPMRDGVRLFTAVYVPKDDSRPYPILLLRTPYGIGPYGVDQYKADIGPSTALAKEGYIFVYQDVRGRMMSEGEFINMRPHQPIKSQPTQIDESTDTFDTIDWLLKRVPNHNGKVGQWGISYPGFCRTASTSWRFSVNPARSRRRNLAASDSIMGRRTAMTSSCCSDRWPTPTPVISRATSPSGPKR